MPLVPIVISALVWNTRSIRNSDLRLGRSVDWAVSDDPDSPAAATPNAANRLLVIFDRADIATSCLMMHSTRGRRRPEQPVGLSLRRTSSGLTDVIDPDGTLGQESSSAKRTGLPRGRPAIAEAINFEMSGDDVSSGSITTTISGFRAMPTVVRSTDTGPS